MKEIRLPPGLLHEIKTHKPALFLGAGAAIYDLFSEADRMPTGKDIKYELLSNYYNEEEELEDGAAREEKLKELEFRFIEDFSVKVTLTPEIVWSKILGDNPEGLTPNIKILNGLVDRDKPVPPNYKYIARLALNDKISTIVTTNFDEKLESAFESVVKNETTKINAFLRAVADPDFDNYKQMHGKGDLKIIYKLHGSLSSPYTIRSSKTGLRKLSNYKFEALKDIFERNDLIIFIGYSCNDDDIFNALQKISRDIKDKPKLYWFSRGDEIPPNAAKVIKKFEGSGFIGGIESYALLREICEKLVPTISPHEKEFPEVKLLRKYNPKVVETLREKKVFEDPVFGDVSFDKNYSRFVSTLINSAEVQRLRDIKQLSFVHYRFPGATHSRFHHSLGVAYLVSRALEKLRKEDKVSKRTAKNTVYSAILHDIGHGPFGHVIDTFADRINKPHLHEKLTIDFIKKGLLDLPDMMDYVDLRKELILDIIKNTYHPNPEKFSDYLFLSQMIGGSALDFDRLDFLIRDIYYTGYSTKSVPGVDLTNVSKRLELVDSLVGALEVGEHPEFEGTSVLCFNIKIKDLILKLIDLYVDMYANVYNCKTNICAQSMIAKALECACDLGDINLADLYKYTDSELFTLLENSDNPVVKELAWATKYRRLFKSIVDFTIDSKWKPRKIEEKIITDLKIEETDFKSLIIVSAFDQKKIGPLFFKDGKKVTLHDTNPNSIKLQKKRRGHVLVPWDSPIAKPKEIGKILKVLKNTECTNISCKTNSDKP